MSNPNADRIAALSHQTGSTEAEVTAVLAGQYLFVASTHDEQAAAAAALGYAHDWLSIIAGTDEPSQPQRESGLALQNLLSKDADGEYRAPITRLLSAVANGDTANPNPTPAFGSLR